MNFPKDIATFINNNISSLTLGTNLFYNTPIKDNDVIPNLSVFVYNASSSKPDRSFNGCVEIRYPKVIILVRSNIEGSIDGNELETANDITESIYSLVQSATITGYKDIKFMNSIFQQVNKDDENRHIFSNTVQGMKVSTP